MELKLLTKDEVELIYNERMVKDFPEEEIKPLNVILTGMDEKKYFCYGLKGKNEILGYTFVLKLIDSNDYLIDYLATSPDERNKGLGAKILNMLFGILEGATCIIGEVEDPDYAKNEEEKKLQTRRFNFYMRNGFRDTGVRAEVFGVEFRIIETGAGLKHTEYEISTLYKTFLKSVLTRELYENNVSI